MRCSTSSAGACWVCRSSTRPSHERANPTWGSAPVRGTLMNANGALILGAVAYDPKVVTIWGGFRTWLIRQGLAFDFVLYSNYERQVEDLVADRIHLAWNS